MKCRRLMAGLTAVAVTVAAASCGSSSSAPVKTAAAQPSIREREPNDGSVTANGPVGATGITLTTAKHMDEDFVYFKLKPDRKVTITVKHTRGECSEATFSTGMPGGPGGGNGGEDQTALRDDAPGIDNNGNQDPRLGPIGSIARLVTTVQVRPDKPDPASGYSPDQTPKSYRGGVVLGYLAGDTPGCVVHVAARPADALVVARASSDAGVLRDPDLVQIGADD